jgi:hypothetical protein
LGGVVSSVLSLADADADADADSPSLSFPSIRRRVGGWVGWGQRREETGCYVFFLGGAGGPKRAQRKTRMWRWAITLGPT